MKAELLYLQENFDQADESANQLISSMQRCNDFILKNNYSEDQLIELEALTGRFARLSDIVIQKIFKTIDVIEGTSPGTVRDRLLQAEKKNIVISADEFMEIRKVRNKIAHEYEMNGLKDIFLFAFQNADLLINAINNAKEYSKKFY